MVILSKNRAWRGPRKVIIVRDAESQFTESEQKRVWRDEFRNSVERDPRKGLG